MSGPIVNATGNENFAMAFRLAARDGSINNMGGEIDLMRSTTFDGRTDGADEALAQIEALRQKSKEASKAGQPFNETLSITVGATAQDAMTITLRFDGGDAVVDLKPEDVTPQNAQTFVLPFNAQLLAARAQTGPTAEADFNQLRASIVAKLDQAIATVAAAGAADTRPAAANEWSSHEDAVTRLQMTRDRLANMPFAVPAK